MVQIRSGVFETNSSSMHSLVIRNKDAFYEDESIYVTSEEVLDDFRINKNGVSKVYKDEDWYFGRAPFKILSSFFDKMKYAFANNYPYEEIFEIVKDYIPDITKIEVPEFLGTDDYQLSGWLERAGIDLREFLTNKKYVIICDGDEYCLWEDLKKAGIIDKNSFTEI